MASVSIRCASTKKVATDSALVAAALVVGLVEVAFDSRVLDRAVHSFDLPIIRYEIRRRLAVRLFPERKMAIW